MRYLISLSEGLDLTLCAAMMLLVGLAAVLIVPVRLRRRLRQAELGGMEGTALADDWRLGKREWVLVGLIAAMSIALGGAQWLDGRREKSETVLVRAVEEGIGQYFRGTSEPRYWPYQVARTRLRALGTDRNAEELAGMAGYKELGPIYQPPALKAALDPLEGVKWAGYWTLPVVAALWLALGASFVVAVKAHGEARAAAFGGKAAGMGAGRQRFALSTGGCLWLLAGATVAWAAAIEHMRYGPWQSAGEILRMAAQGNANDKWSAWKITWMRDLADATDAKNGHRVITPEQRRAFLERTASFDKTRVEVVSPGPGKSGTGPFDPALAPVELAVQGLLYEAGHAGSSTGEMPESARKAAMDKLLEALAETGVAPGAKLVDIPGKWDLPCVITVVAVSLKKKNEVGASGCGSNADRRHHSGFANSIQTCLESPAVPPAPAFMKTLFAIGCLLILCTLACHAEIRDKFVGPWSVTGTSTAPGHDPVKIRYTYSFDRFQKTGLTYFQTEFIKGRGRLTLLINCRDDGEIEGFQTFRGKVVSVQSGTWKITGDTLEIRQRAAGVSGPFKAKTKYAFLGKRTSRITSSNNNGVKFTGTATKER